MKVKMILPALTEATSPFLRPIKYSLFPPLGLATLAAYLSHDDDVEIQDEHVETLDLDDTPDLVVIQVYITSAYRAYRLADHYRRRGAHVALGGLHVTSLPEEAAPHADTIFLGPGEDTWPQFLADFRRGEARPRLSVTGPNARRRAADSPRSDQAAPLSGSQLDRRLARLSARLRLLLQGGVLRGRKGRFYTQTVDAALAEIERLPGRHLYFLDDHLFGDRRFATQLFDGMRGMGRLWQAAGTVNAVLAPGLLERAVEAGLRSLFVGFETLNPANLLEQRKYQNLRRDYADGDSTPARPRRDDQRQLRLRHGRRRWIRVRAHRGVGDRRRASRPRRFTSSRRIRARRLHRRMAAQGRITTDDWDRYDTRHAVFRPARMTASSSKTGYWRAYRDFYRWGSIVRGASAHESVLSAAAPLRVRRRLEEVRAAVGSGDSREDGPG